MEAKTEPQIATCPKCFYVRLVNSKDFLKAGKHEDLLKGLENIEQEVTKLKIELANLIGKK